MKTLLSLLFLCTCFSFGFANSSFLTFSNDWNKAYVYSKVKRADSALFYYRKAEKNYQFDYGSAFLVEMADFYREQKLPKKWETYMTLAIRNGQTLARLRYQVKQNKDSAYAEPYRKLLANYHSIASASYSTLDPNLMQDLNMLAGVDQFFRWDTLIRAVSCTGRSLPAVDSITCAGLTKVFEDYPFPRRSNVGEETHGLFRMMIMHTFMDDAFEARYMPMLYKEVQEGTFPNRFFAIIVDRKRAWKSKQKQLYGMYDFNYRGKVYGTIDDVEHVDERRKAIGMMSLYEEYLAGDITALPKGYVPSAELVTYYAHLKKAAAKP